MPRWNNAFPTAKIVAANDNYPEGYHKGNPGGLDAIETDLAPGNIKDTVNIFGKVGTIEPLPPNATLADFQANAATGTCSSPQNINDNDTDTWAYFNLAGEYAEIDFGKTVLVNQWRLYRTGFSGTSQWDIEVKDLSDTWQLWVELKPAPSGDGWTTMKKTAEVIAKAVRITMTSGISEHIRELEVYHD